MTRDVLLLMLDLRKAARGIRLDHRWNFVDRSNNRRIPEPTPSVKPLRYRSTSNRLLKAHEKEPGNALLDERIRAWAMLQAQ